MRVLTVPNAPGAIFPGTIAGDWRTHRLLVIGGVPFGSAFLSDIDTVTGRAVSTLPLPNGSAIPWLTVDEATQRAFVLSDTRPISSRPLAMGGGQVLVVDTRSGAVIHTIPVAGRPVGAAIDTLTHQVYVAVSGPLSEFCTGGSGANGCSWWPTQPGRVVVLDGRTGRVRRTVMAGVFPADLAVDERRRRVLIADQGESDQYFGPTMPVLRAPLSAPGDVEVLDMASHRTIERIPLGKQPIIVAMDGQAQRAFVVDMGGPPVGAPVDPWSWMPPWLRRHLPFVASRPRPRWSPLQVIMVDTSGP